MSTQIQSISQAREIVERVQNRLSKLRESGEEVARRTSNVGMQVVGGVAAGAIEAKFPVIPRTTIPTNAILGGVITVAGLFGLGGKLTDQTIALGGTMMAVTIAKAIEKRLA